MDRYGKLDRMEAALPSAHYFDPALHEREMAVFFHNRWVCVGRSSEVADPGDFTSVDVAGRTIFVTRTESSVCTPSTTPAATGDRHCARRSAALSMVSSSARITPGLMDSMASSSPHRTSCRRENFDTADFGLYEVGLEEWEGFLYVHLGTGPPSLLSDPSFGRASDLFKNYHTGELEVAARLEYDVECNWKLIVENSRSATTVPAYTPSGARPSRA